MNNYTDVSKPKMLIPGNTNGAGDLDSLSDCLLASELACCSSLLCRRWASRAIWYSFREAEEPVFSTIFRSWEWGFCRRWYGLSISFSWPLLTTWGLGGGRWREEGGGSYMWSCYSQQSMAELCNAQLDNYPPSPILVKWHKSSNQLTNMIEVIH